jgi:solute carrier family 8 (sodium/calcium exchanger)
VTAVIGDVASHFGCTLGIKDSVTAIVFVALGTSIPGEFTVCVWMAVSQLSLSLSLSLADTFASKVAAIQDKYADASVGNVTGSNAVNVFLGIGLAWTMAAIYHWSNGDVFRVESGKWVGILRKFWNSVLKTVSSRSLAFSVTLFCSEAVIAILILLVRRNKSIGGELGGPPLAKYVTATLLIGLWLIYLIASSLEAYGVIKVGAEK